MQQPKRTTIAARSLAPRPWLLESFPHTDDKTNIPIKYWKKIHTHLFCCHTWTSYWQTCLFSSSVTSQDRPLKVENSNCPPVVSSPPRAILNPAGDIQAIKPPRSPGASPHAIYSSCSLNPTPVSIVWCQSHLFISRHSTFWVFSCEWESSDLKSWKLSLNSQYPLHLSLSFI